ncbi:MAG: hypothetical protein AAFX01_05635 [Cyanobacteria bacterium J06638_28]
MATLAVSVEQILTLIQQLPLDSKQAIFEVLRQDVHDNSLARTALDEESQDWLEAELVSMPPEYDWGQSGMLEGMPVHYVAGQGLVFAEADIGKS